MLGEGTPRPRLFHSAIQGEQNGHFAYPSDFQGEQVLTLLTLFRSPCSPLPCGRARAGLRAGTAPPPPRGAGEEGRPCLPDKLHGTRLSDGAASARGEVQNAVSAPVSEAQSDALVAV